MRNPIVRTLAICPYCRAEFTGREDLKTVDTCLKHIRERHPETEKCFQEIDRKAAIVPNVKLLKGGI